MQATSLVSPRGDGEEFFLDILFYRMSEIGISQQQPMNGLTLKMAVSFL